MLSLSENGATACQETVLLSGNGAPCQETVPDLPTGLEFFAQKTAALRGFTKLNEHDTVACGSVRTHYDLLIGRGYL